MPRFSADEAESLRLGFYEQILSKSPSRPETDFRRLAEAWLKVTNADWVWLWLKNPFSRESPWELRELACREPDRERKRYILRPLAARALNTVTAYCSKTERAEVIENIDDWRRNIGGETYTVHSAETLKSLGCRCFVTQPFREPPSESTLTPQKSRIEGAICSHFCDREHFVPSPYNSLRLMGQLTALTIVNSFKAAQQDILIELNSLAQDYLTRVSTKPHIDRQKYLLEVIELLRRHLSIRAASIFYQEDPQFPEMRCLATTGLTDNPPSVMPPERWGAALYRQNEGLTGTCFSTGEVKVLSAADAQRHTPKYVEVLDGEIVGRNDAVLFPIPRPKNDGPAARGVIRCSDHRTVMHDGLTRPFDPVDVETLGFIARQIAPVVETLSVRIRREETISIIKHDLLAPLVMIRDTAQEMIEDIDDPGEIIKAKYYDVMNLGTAALVASNLVQQLDAEPGQIRQFALTRTLLEKTIVVRIKKMLTHYAERENNMQIRFEGFRDIPPLWIDRDLMERVLVNLLTNAIKYGGSGTTIDVFASVDDEVESFRIDVSNQGIGVSKEDAELIFDRGYRSKSVIGKKMGIGLGLFIARAAVERHNGRLLLTHLQNPTTFSIYLPIALKRGPL